MIRALFFALVLLLPGFSHAVAPSCQVLGVPGASAAEACAAAGPYYSKGQFHTGGYGINIYTTSLTSPNTCLFTCNWGAFCTGSEPVGCTCPEGTVLNADGSACNQACPSGQTNKPDGSCAVPCPGGLPWDSSGQCPADCASRAGTAQSMWCQVSSPTSTSCNLDVDGCQVKCSSVTFNAGKSGAGSVQIYPRDAFGENCRFTGQQPQPTDGSGSPVTNDEWNDIRDRTAKDPSPSKCAAAGSDFVQLSSGVKVCAGSGTDVAKGSEKQTVSSPTATNGGTPGSTGQADSTAPGSSEKTVGTSCKGDECTTRETTRTDPNPGVNGTTNSGCAAGQTLVSGKCEAVKTTTESAGDYCTKNPNDKICKAVGNSDCEKKPNSAGCTDLGSPSDDGSVITTKAIGVESISTVAFSANSSCPADIPLPNGASFSFRWSCDMATSLKPFILALAWLSAGLIVMGAFKSG